MYVTTVRVYGEADTESGDTVQKDPPRGDVEERCRDLAPRCEARPIEVGESESPACRLGDARDDRQRELGPCEVRRVDHEPVDQTQQIAERPRPERRRSGPPEEDWQIWHEKWDHGGGEAVVDIAFRAKEDLLVADEPSPVGDRQAAVHLDALLDAVARSAIREHDDRTRWVTECQVGDASCRTARVLLAISEHYEIQDRRTRNRASELACVRALRAAKPGQLALERRDAALARSPERRVDGYDFRHFRPSRSISASASDGPHVPASYSARPWGDWAQPLMIGSTKLHC